MAIRKGQSRAKQPLGNLIAPFVSSVLVLAVNLGVPIDAELQNAILSAIVCGWAVLAGAWETYKHHKDG
jgi:hypothetical protein